MSERAFVPSATVTLAVTSSSGNVAMPSSGALIAVVQNTGTKHCFIKLGMGSGLTAATTDTPLPSGKTCLLDIDQNTYIAAICGGSDTTTIYVTVGAGLASWW